MSRITEKTWIPIGLAAGAVVFAATAWGVIAVMKFQVDQHAESLKSVSASQQETAKSLAQISTDIAVIKTEMKGLRFTVKRQHAEEVAVKLVRPRAQCAAVFGIPYTTR